MSVSFFRTREIGIHYKGRPDRASLFIEISGPVDSESGMVLNLSLVDRWFDGFERSGIKVSSLEELLLGVCDEACPEEGGLGQHKISLRTVTVALVGRGETWRWQATEPQDVFVMSQIPARFDCGLEALIIGPICVMHTREDRMGIEIPSSLDLKLPNTEALESALDDLFPQFIEISLVDTLTKQKWRWVR